MPRNPVPLHLTKKHLTKAEIASRQSREQNLHQRLKRDKIRAPDWLDTEAIKLFRYIVKEYDAAEMLTNLDVNALATYCDLHSRRLQLLEDVRTHGTSLVNQNARGDTITTVNPALTSLNTTIKLLQSYEGRFGFTIFDRTKIALKDEKPEEADAFKRTFGS